MNFHGFQSSHSHQKFFFHNTLTTSNGSESKHFNSLSQIFLTFIKFQKIFFSLGGNQIFCAHLASFYHVYFGIASCFRFYSRRPFTEHGKLSKKEENECKIIFLMFHEGKFC